MVPRPRRFVASAACLHCAWGSGGKPNLRPGGGKSVMAVQGTGRQRLRRPPPRLRRQSLLRPQILWQSRRRPGPIRWRDPVDSLGLTDRLGTVESIDPWVSQAEDRVMPPTPGG